MSNPLAGRFIIAATYHKPGRKLLDGLVITPWPTGTVRSTEQKALTCTVLDKLADRAIAYFNVASNGDWRSDQAWIDVPEHQWVPCPKHRDELIAIAMQHLTLKWEAIGNPRAFDVNIT